MKVLETAVGAVFAPTRFSLVRISIRDLVADGKSLVRNSGVGGGGENLILRLGVERFVSSLESLSSLGFEGKTWDVPGILPGCPGPLGGVQKVCAKK